MPGVRIQAVDPALADTEVILPEPGKTITRDGVTHPKRHYFRLDATASCIVAEPVWEILQYVMANASGAPRFVAVGEVQRPPTQGMNMGAASTVMRPAVELQSGLLVPVGLRPQPSIIH